MPSPDWIPVLSQLKATVQLITGDFEGFARTLENFVKECPGVSQVTSVLQLVAGEPKDALETQKRCLGTISNVINIFPVAGHINGAIHHIVGDHDGGNHALNAATRSTVVMGAAIAATEAPIPEEFIFLGSIAGVGYDIAATIVTGRTQGCVAVIRNAIENPSAGTIFDAVVFIPTSDFFLISLIAVSVVMKRFRIKFN